MTEKELFASFQDTYCKANAARIHYSAKSAKTYSNISANHKEEDDKFKLSSEANLLLDVAGGGAISAVGVAFAPFGIPIALLGAFKLAKGCKDFILTHKSTRENNLAYKAEEAQFSIENAMRHTMEGNINPAEHDSLESVLAEAQRLNIERERQHHITENSTPEDIKAVEEAAEDAFPLVDLKELDKLALKAHASNPDQYERFSNSGVEKFEMVKSIISGAEMSSVTTATATTDAVM